MNNILCLVPFTVSPVHSDIAKANCDEEYLMRFGHYPYDFKNALRLLQGQKSILINGHDRN